MGATASGKTGVAVALRERLPVDIISVDSALVYRGMDIGTAKPDADTLARAPHQLIDIRDPEDSYSAGEFVRDATAAIEASHAAGRLPLLVGGTMLYFRALTEGIADMPAADAALRAAIDAEAGEVGWPAMHARLAEFDPATAARIAPHDRQRIQRATEVWRSSGRPLSAWHDDAVTAPSTDYQFARIGLSVEPRAALHARIETRLDAMLAEGFEDEVRRLYSRPGLTAAHASMRSVGYRQFWACISTANTRPRRPATGRCSPRGSSPSASSPGSARCTGLNPSTRLKPRQSPQ